MLGRNIEIKERSMGRFCFCCRIFRPSSSSSVKPLFWNILRISLLIVVYYLLSIGLTFYQNKLLKKIHFPLTIVLCHLFVKFVLSSLCRLGYEMWTKSPRIFVDFDIWVKKLSLVGISGGLDIGLSNWGQEFITVSLYTMSKSTAIVFILLFALLFKLEEKHWSLVIIVGMISTGLFMFTYKSTQFQLNGFLLIIGASFVSGLRWSMAQLIAQRSKLGLQNPIDMVYHFQPWMIAAVLPFAIYFEGGSLLTQKVALESPEEKAAFVHNIYAILIGAFMAFFMEIAEYLLVIHTSSLTLSVAGVFKEICTLALAVELNGDVLTFVNVVGLFLCFIGIVCHVVFKFVKNAKEMEHPTMHGYSGPECSKNAGNGLEYQMKEVNEREDKLPLLNEIEEMDILQCSDSDEEVWSRSAEG